MKNGIASKDEVSVKVVRQINWLLLIGTAIVVTVGGVGAYFLREYQVHRTAKSYFDRALALEAKGDGRQAAEYLYRYTRLRPNDVEPNDVKARVKLAQIFDEISGDGEKGRAIDLYLDALAFVKDDKEQFDLRLDLRRRLAELLLKTGQFAPAKVQALEIRALVRGGSEDPNKSEVGCDAERILAEVVYQQYVMGVIGENELVGGKTIWRVIEDARSLNPLEMRLAEIAADVYRSHPELVHADEAFQQHAEDASQQGERDADADKTMEELADQIMEELVDRDPKNHESHLTRFRYLRRYNLPGAGEELDKALKFGPDVLVVRLAAADDSWRKGARLIEDRRLASAEGDAGAISDEDPEELFAKAREHLEYILTNIDPDSLLAHMALVDVYLLEGRPDEAKSAWAKGLESAVETSLPTNVRIAKLSLSMRMAEAMARENDPQTENFLQRVDQSLDALRAGLSSEGRNSLARTRDLVAAHWLLQREKPAKAIPLLEAIAAGGHGLGTQHAHGILAWQRLAQAYGALEQWEEAAKAYQSAAELAPENWRLRLNAGMMWQKAGQPRLAISYLRRAAPIANTPGAWLALAGSHFDATLQLPKLERQRGEPAWEPFLQALAKTKAVSRGKEIGEPWLVDLLEVNYQVVTAADEQAGRAQALPILQRIDEDHPDDVALCLNLASTYERWGESARADECLQRLARLTPDSHVSYLKRAEVLSWRKEYDGASKVLTDAIKQLPTKEQLPLRQALVQLAFIQGDFETARAGLVKLHQANRDDPRPLYQLLELALRRGKLNEAEEWESTLLRTEGRLSARGRYYRIVRLAALAVDADDSCLSLAEKELRQLLGERQDWPRTHSAAALVYEKRGQLGRASDALEKAIQLGDGSVATYARLVQLLSMQGLFGPADVYLKRLGQRVPESSRLSSLAIRAAAEMNDLERAETYARDGIKSRPRDAMAQLWLGQVLLAQKEYEDAEKAFREAKKLAPHDVQTWNGLFTLYLRTGRGEEASEVLVELAKHVDLTDGKVAFVQAQGYELLGDRQTAKERFAAAEKAAPDHFSALEHFHLQMRIAQFYLTEEAALAEKAYRKALEIDPTSGLARRSLAVMLAGDPARWEEARRLLTEGGDTADKRVQAALLALRRSGDRVADLEAALRILEELVRRATNPTDESRLLLAFVYSELSKMQLQPQARDRLVQSARSQFRSLLDGRDRPNRSHLAIYIRFLLDHDNLEDAKRRLDDWEQESPDSLLFVSLKARWLHGAGEDEKIEPLVERIATKAEEQLDTQEERLGLYSSVGQIYAGVENHVAAQRWFDRLASAGGERFGPLAMSLAAQGLHEEAVNLCLRAAESDDSSLPATVLASLLLDASDYQPPEDVEQLLAMAPENHPRDSSLLTAVANLRLVQGNSSAAIALYQRIVELRPNDPVTLNNLATLLAEEEGRRKEGLEFIGRAIRFAGPLPPLLDTKGTILLRSGNLDEAIKALEMAASTPRADPRYHFHLALALDKQDKDPARAKSELKAALDGNLTSTVLTSVDQANLAALRQKHSL